MPRVTLTPKNIRSLKPRSGKRTDYRDTVVPGLELRVSRTGVRTWAVVYPKGRTHARLTLGPIDAFKTLKDVRDSARGIRARAALGADPARVAAEAKRARVEGITVEQLGERFMQQMKLQNRLRPKTESEYQRLIDVEITPAIGALPTEELTRGEVRDAVRAIEARGAPYVANRTFQMIRRLFAWGVEEDLVRGTPCVGMRKPAQEEPNDRVLSREELRALQLAIDTSSDLLADVVRLLLLTGVRLGMALGAGRAEFHDLEHPDAARWVIPGGYGGRSKNRRAHVVPLSKPALEVVQRRLAAWKGELLFPNRDDHTKPAVWRSGFTSRIETRLREQLNAARVERKEAPLEAVPDWHVHHLRHTMRTHLREMLGVRDDVAELIVGHVRRGVQGIYNRAELLPERRAALVAWADWLEKVKAEQPAKVLPMQKRA